MQDETKGQAMFTLVEQWQQSGKSKKTFSQENQLKVATLSYWVKKYQQVKAGEQGFAALTISPDQRDEFSAPRIEVELSGGIIVRIY